MRQRGRSKACHGTLISKARGASTSSNWENMRKALLCWRKRCAAILKNGAKQSTHVTSELPRPGAVTHPKAVVTLRWPRKFDPHCPRLRREKESEAPN